MARLLQGRFQVSYCPAVLSGSDTGRPVKHATDSAITYCFIYVYGAYLPACLQLVLPKQLDALRWDLVDPGRSTVGLLRQNLALLLSLAPTPCRDDCSAASLPFKRRVAHATATQRKRRGVPSQATKLASPSRCGTCDAVPFPSCHSHLFPRLIATFLLHFCAFSLSSNCPISRPITA